MVQTTLQIEWKTLFILPDLNYVIFLLSDQWTILSLFFLPLRRGPRDRIKSDVIVLWYRIHRICCLFITSVKTFDLLVLVPRSSRLQTTPERRTKSLPTEEQHRGVSSLFPPPQLLRSTEHWEEYSRDEGKYSRSENTGLMEGFQGGGLWQCYPNPKVV